MISHNAAAAIVIPASPKVTRYRGHLVCDLVIFSPSPLARGSLLDLLSKGSADRDRFALRPPVEAPGSISSMRRASRLTAAGSPPEVTAMSATRCAVKR